MTDTTEIEVLPAINALAPLEVNPGQSRQEQLENLRAEAEFLEIAAGLAEKACSNGGQLVAQHFRGKPADGAIAIAYGSSLGWHWTKSLQDVYVVNGKPSIQSKEMRELLIRAGHNVWEEEVGPERVVLAGTRRGSDIVVRVEWTMDKARQAKLTSNPNYDKFPENMLYARCTTDLAKRLAPDALSGLGIYEELQDMQHAERVQSERPAQRARGVAALREAAAAAQPAADPPAAPEKPLTKAARQKWLNRMFGLLGEVGVVDRLEQLAVEKHITGRDDIEHRDELTDDELRDVVNMLNDWEKAGGLGPAIRAILNPDQTEASNA